MNTLSYMDPKAGDVKQTWDPRNPTEVEAARKLFNDLKGKHFEAYRAKADGGKHTRMTEFDPEAGAIIMAPVTAGG
jgi:hypothetical protein